MHQIGVVGLSYRHADVDQVSRFAVPRAEVAARLPALRAQLGVAEIVYIGTCNRVEVIYATGDGGPAADSRDSVFRLLTGTAPRAGEAARTLRAWTGEAAVEHLFLVACGLDSAQTGEQEITAQLRDAWEESRAAGTSGPLLDRVLGDALAMARRTHRLTTRAHAPSLGELAAERVRRHLTSTSGTVALLGVSPMTRRCAVSLHRARVPLLIVNRTLEAARQLADSVAGEALSLDDFRAAPPRLAALVLAAGGAGPVLDAAVLARLATLGAGPLVIDFGVPPNVDPDAARQAGLARVGMSDLIEAAQGRRLTELVRLAPVRAAIDERLARLRAELATRAIGPRLAQLRLAFEAIAAEEVAHALRHELRSLDDHERAQLERLGCAVARRLAHLPLAGLKAAALHASADAVDAFFDAAKAAPAREAGARPMREPRGAADALHGPARLAEGKS